jgi:eukaryotic-like serine/threonine-protein kinase
LAESGELTSQVIADKYELVRLLGAGGMGAVYEARHVVTRKRCAVKLLLKPELASDAEVSRRFFREARAGGLIESEHVVAAYDSGVDAEGRLYYVMECLDGEDLSSLLERVGSLRPATVVKIMMHACAGLASAHALGVVHRDIKPGNLFLAVGPGDEVKVKILDFGVAKVKMEVFDESANSLTRIGTLLGTPQYMSPEQVKRASTIDQAADIWSLGVVMYECLTGALPWGDVESVGELIAAILTLEVPVVQAGAPWVQPDLAEIAQRTLSRIPSQRLRSATELRDLLLRLSSSDARLYLHELCAPTELERSMVAPPLVLADTLPVGESGSGIPVVATPVPRRASRWSIVAAATAIAGAAAWTLREPAGAAPGPSALAAPMLSASTSTPATPAPSPPTQASASPLQALPLEITPASASVSVDGVSKAVNAGRVLIEGPVGAVRRVRLAHLGQSREQTVAITANGLMPARLVLAAKSAISAASSLSAPTNPPPPTPAVPAEPASGAVLTPTFE